MAPIETELGHDIQGSNHFATTAQNKNKTTKAKTKMKARAKAKARAKESKAHKIRFVGNQTREKNNAH